MSGERLFELLGGLDLELVEGAAETPKKRNVRLLSTLVLAAAACVVIAVVTIPLTWSVGGKDGNMSSANSSNNNMEINAPGSADNSGAAEDFDNEPDVPSGTIRFYSEPTEEFTEPDAVEYLELGPDEAAELREIVDGVSEWVDDGELNRPKYYFAGEFTLDGDVYYFSYESLVIYRDGLIGTVTEEDMERLRSMYY